MLKFTMSPSKVLYRAVQMGDINVLLHLHSIHSQDELSSMTSEKTGGRTPLCEACEKGHQNIIKFLLEKYHANIDQTSKVFSSGEYLEVTPLHLAILRGNLDIVKLLVSHGANVNSAINPRTPLLMACVLGNLDIVKCLVEHGADVEAEDSDGATCLIIACRRGDIALVKYFLSAKANVNKRIPSDGNTALHECCWSFPPANFKIFMTLLQYGASLDIVNLDGTCPVLYAAVKHQHSLVAYLIEEPHLLTDQKKIDALEVLGASSIFYDGNVTLARLYWKQALKERYRRGLKKPTKEGIINSSIHGNCIEFQDKTDLDGLVGNLDAMEVQALLILERVLGPLHPFTTSFILYKGYRGVEGTFDRCLEHYYYAFDKYQEHPFHPSVKVILSAFKDLFVSMVKKEELKLVVRDELLKVISRTVRHLELSKRCLEGMPSNTDKRKPIKIVTGIVEITLELATQIIKIKNKDEDKPFEYEMHKSLYTLIKLELRFDFGVSLLHLSCYSNRKARNLPCVPLTKLLVKLGANSDDQDEVGNTSSHFAAMLRPFQPDLLQVLIDGGAHVDVANENGKTVCDFVPDKYKSVYRRMIFNSRRLSCLSARVIKRNRILYKGVVPVHLEKLVSLH